MEEIIFGLDIGTTKVCALVGEVRGNQLQIIGMGVQPARGMRKGMVIDVAEASVAIAKAVEEAEQTSGYDLSQALVSMAGEHISSLNNRGVVGIGRDGAGVNADDIGRALDAAQAIPIPHNRQIVHLIPRSYTVDEQSNVRSPLGMHGFRLEVEAHIVTGASPACSTCLTVPKTWAFAARPLF
jgi:cell division protein FtsA